MPAVAGELLLYGYRSMVSWTVRNRDGDRMTGLVDRLEREVVRGAHCATEGFGEVRRGAGASGAEVRRRFGGRRGV